jgi:hypothetical protein
MKRQNIDPGVQVHADLYRHIQAHGGAIRELEYDPPLYMSRDLGSIRADAGEVFNIIRMVCEFPTAGAAVAALSTASIIKAWLRYKAGRKIEIKISDMQLTVSGTNDPEKMKAILENINTVEPKNFELSAHDGPATSRKPIDTSSRSKKKTPAK